MSGSGDTTRKVPAGQEVLPIPPGFPAPSPADLASQRLTVIDPGRARSGSGEGGALAAPPEPTRQPVPGYEVLRELARGGMGVVYEAWSQRLGRSVALKVIQPELLLDPDAISRLEREVAAQGRLRHPNIVSVLDAGRVQSCPWVAMELVPGETLQQRVRREGPLPERLAATWTRKLAEALAHAHALGVLHRDLKPHNVLLAPDGQPRLIDFGLARLQDDRQRLTMTGMILGTPAYMAPEQAAGLREEVDRRSDVYGLGTVLYEMLTARAPWEGRSQLEVLEAVINGRLTPPSTHRPDLDPQLEAICLRCLARDPGERFQDMQELAAALERWGVGEERAGPGAPLVTALALGACLLAGLGLLSLLPAPAEPHQGRTPSPAPGPPPAPPSPPEQQPAFEALVDPSAASHGDPAREAFTTWARRLVQDPRRIRTSTPELAPLADDPQGSTVWHALARSALGRSSDHPDLERPPLSAWASLFHGAEEVAAGRMASARSALQRALEEDPQLWVAAWLLAQVELDQGRLEEGLRVLGPLQGRELAPILATQAIACCGLQDLEDGRVLALRAVELDPRLVDGWRALVLLSLEERWPDAALEALERLKELRPPGPEDDLMRSQALAELGEWAAALRVALPLSQRQDHLGFSGRMVVAEACLELGRLDEARRALETVPQAQSAALARAIEAERTRRERAPLPPAGTGAGELAAYARERIAAADWRGVRAALERFLQLVPDQHDAWMRLADTHIELSHTALACRALREAFARRPPGPPEQQLLMGCLGAVGRFEEVLEECQRARLETPEDRWRVTFYALQARWRLGRPWPGYAREADALVDTAPSSEHRATATWLRAQLRLQNGDPRGALDDLRRIAEQPLLQPGPGREKLRRQTLRLQEQLRAQGE